MNRKLLIFPLLLVLLGMGCPTRISPDTKISKQTTRTARTLHPYQTEIGFGFLVPRQEDLGLTLPVRVGLPAHLEVRSNVAHFLFGVPNAALEYQFHESESMILSGAIGGFWLHPPFMTILPNFLKDGLGDVHIFSIPVELTGTFPFSDWFELSTRLVYTHSSLVGSFSDGSSGFSGSIGTRELAIEPILSFKTWEYAYLTIGVEAPVYAMVPAQAGGTIEPEEGIILGLNTAGQQELDVLGLYTTSIALEFHYGDVSRLRLYGTYGQRFLESRSESLIPGMELFWRF